MGTLYLVATPIGNLEDMTYRAVRVLSQVGLVAAEDTRRTRHLLSHYAIQTQLISYYEQNKLGRIEPVLAALSLGDVALVSDAGTPALNDPGYELVRAVLDAGFTVSAIPGPSAPLAALITSGLPTDAFLYLGYLPRKPGDRRRVIEKVAGLPYTLIFLETPHRLLQALADLEHGLGSRQMAAARELTKLHEEIRRGSIQAVREHFTQNKPRGEFTLVIAGAETGAQRWSAEELERVLRDRLQAGELSTRAAAELARQSGWPKRDIYRMLLENPHEPG